MRGGFITKPIEFYKPLGFEESRWEFSAAQIRSFESIVSILEDNGKRVIFVQAPVAGDYYHSFVNNEEFDNLLNSYGSYWNYNAILQLNDEVHFQDYHHMNQYGIEIFSKGNTWVGGKSASEIVSDE